MSDILMSSFFGKLFKKVKLHVPVLIENTLNTKELKELEKKGQRILDSKLSYYNNVDGITAHMTYYTKSNNKIYETLRDARDGSKGEDDLVLAVVMFTEGTRGFSVIHCFNLKSEYFK